MPRVVRTHKIITCADCGGTFETLTSASERCPICAQEAVREARRTGRRDHRAEAASYWMVIYDPTGEDWQEWHSRFMGADLQDMLRHGYVEPGTRIRNTRTKCDYVVSGTFLEACWLARIGTVTPETAT